MSHSFGSKRSDRGHNGDGKVSIESKTKTEVENGKDQETKTKSEGTSGAFDLALCVRSIKTLSSSYNQQRE